VIYGAPGGGLSNEQQTALKDCALNQPLNPGQFDYRGLDLKDGDLILNQMERVAYIIKNGEKVKLANFGDRSVLQPARPTPAEARAQAPDSKLTGKNYTTASLRLDSASMPINSVVAIDPNSGDVRKVFDGFPGRLRVSHVGRSILYIERDVVWIRAIAAGGEPKQILDLGGDSGGAVPVWSGDGKQIIISPGNYDNNRKQWSFKTLRVNSDGSGRETFKIPAEDGVQDWSADGEWVVTTSSRNAKIGWQLHLMRLDGTGQRQITEGGNPFYAQPEDHRHAGMEINRKGMRFRRLFCPVSR